MTMKKIFILLPILLLILILFMKNREGDGFFTAYFNEIIKSAESEDLEKFMVFFSIHYKDDSGYNYIIIRNIVKNTFDEFDTLEGSFSNLTSRVEKQGERKIAIVNMDVEATGIRNGVEVGVLGLNNAPENITIYIEKSSFGKWKIIKIEGIERREKRKEEVQA